MSTTPEPHPEDAERFERALSSVMRLLDERHTQSGIARRSGHDLPPASWALLEHLDARGSMRVSDIAACHGVDVSSVTPRVKALESAGLVHRHGSPEDRRVALITLSEEGRRALESVHAARAELLADALDGISTRDLAAAADVLTAVATRLGGLGA